MECNLVWNHTHDFKIERTRSASSIWNHKYDFRPKFHDKKFNYHFIESILKSHNFMALNFRFCCIVPSSRFVKNSGTGNALTSYLVCKTMSCDENSFKHNKQTSSSGEQKRSISCIKVRFSTPESWWKTFLSSVVEAETSRCLWGRNLRLQPV